MSLERDITRFIRYDLLGLGGAAPFVLDAPAPSAAPGRPKVRVSGAFVSKPVKLCVAGQWYEKPVKVRIAGSFVSV